MIKEKKGGDDHNDDPKQSVIKMEEHGYIAKEKEIELGGQLDESDRIQKDKDG